MSKIKAQIPNLLTAGNLVGGIMAIIFSLTGRLEWAPYCIFVSAILDFLDGFVARLLKVQSELGKQLDSLADKVTFGVAPGIIVFQLLKISALEKIAPEIWKGIIGQSVVSLPMSKLNETFILINSLNGSSYLTYLPFIAFIIPVMSMFRLAKFNLDTRQTDSFIGLPTPANTLFFASLPLILSSYSGATENPFQNFVVDLILNPIFLISSTLVMSFMLVAELPLFALKFKSFGWKGNEIRYIFLTLSATMLATLHWLGLPLIIILYLLLSLIQNLSKK